MIILCAILFRLEVNGRENIPKSGGLIVVSNHASLLDPVLVAVAVTRPVSYMAKEELFHPSFAGWFLRKLNAFPVNRKRVDMSTIRHGINILHSGKVLALFPEGTRSQDGTLQQARLGAAMYARKTGVPVLPVGIVGSANALKRGSWLIKPTKVKIRIGKPLIFDDKKGDAKKVEKAELQDITQEIMKAISELAK